MTVAEQRGLILGSIIDHLEGVLGPVAPPETRDDRQLVNEFPALGSVVWEWIYDSDHQGTGRSGVVVRHVVTEDGERAVVCWSVRRNGGRSTLVPSKLRLDELDATTVKGPERHAISVAVRGLLETLTKSRSWIKRDEREVLFTCVALVEMIEVK